MSLKTKSWLMGLVTAGAVLAVGAAQAEVALLSLKKDAMHGAPSLFKHVQPNHAFKAPVEDFATGIKGTPVEVDGWAFIDQTKCVQIGVPEPFAVPTDDPNGTWSSTLIQSTLGSGACPGVMFTFSDITFTQTGGKSGALDKQLMAARTTSIQKYYRRLFGLPSRAKIVDKVFVTLG
jgi:hypothetical protein